MPGVKQSLIWLSDEEKHQRASFVSFSIVHPLREVVSAFVGQVEECTHFCEIEKNTEH
jgi:hypothetical protein